MGVDSKTTLGVHMRNFLNEVSWIEVAGVQVMSATIDFNNQKSLCVRDMESGHTMAFPVKYTDFQKACQAEAIGRFMMEHPDAKLVEVNGEYRYTYTVDGQEQITRLGSTPQQALILTIC